MAQYQCKHFKIKELVHPDYLKKTTETILWNIFDERLLKFQDFLRDKYGAIYVNTAQLQNCGLRLNDSSTGAGYSAHKYGRAFDSHIQTIENKKLPQKEKAAEYEKIREAILNMPEWSFISFEKGVYWLHSDTYNRQNRLFLP